MSETVGGDARESRWRRHWKRTRPKSLILTGTGDQEVRNSLVGFRSSIMSITGEEDHHDAHHHPTGTNLHHDSDTDSDAEVSSQPIITQTLSSTLSQSMSQAS